MATARHAPEGRDMPPSASAATMDLLKAAARADLQACRDAIRSNADVNAADSAGRTAIMLTIGGESPSDIDASDASYALQTRLSILKLLLNHADTSLHSLNAPVNGVTPLGLAAWLNAPDIVGLLLKESDSMVSVDGPDLHGATALMYAARDSRLNVVCILLAHGAKPDLIDDHHRSSIHFAREHPHILWLCERTVRQYRAREAQLDNPQKLSMLPSPYLEDVVACPVLHDIPASVTFLRGDLACLTEAVIRAVKAADILTLSGLVCSSMETFFKTGHSAFSTPTIINNPDGTGWGAIHYCVVARTPSLEVLDLLYLGGADVCLYTGTGAGQGSPLHILARNATASTEPSHAKLMQTFIQHLVFDLGAPLAAKDTSLNTCLHVAAEHGHSINVLMALLACDKKGSVRKLRNAKGLTALDVCRPEFLAAFGEEGGPMRPGSSASARTIRPATIISSKTLSSGQDVVSVISTAAPANRVTNTLPKGSEDIQRDMAQLPALILDNLRTLSRELNEDHTGGDVDALETLLQQTTDHYDQLMASMHQRLEDVQADVKYIERMFKQVQQLLDDSAHALGKTLGVSFVPAINCSPALPTGSESTLCSRASTSTSTPPSTPIRKCVSMVNLKSTTAASASGGSPGKLSIKTSRDVPLTSGGGSRVLRGRSSWRVLPQWSKESSSDGDDAWESGRKNKGTDANDVDIRAQAVGGAARIRAWLLKRFGPQETKTEERHDSHEIVVTEPENATGGNSEDPPSEKESQVISTCRRVLHISRRDMTLIQGCMMAAERYTSLAEQALNQTERRLLRIIEKRRATLRTSHLGSPTHSPSLPAQQNSPPSPIHLAVFDARLHSTSSLSSPSSSRSSMISFSSTLIEEEEDDIGALRRLLARKIEARLTGAIDEMDKAEVWLRVIRDVTQRLKDTYLS